MAASSVKLSPSVFRPPPLHSISGSCNTFILPLKLHISGFRLRSSRRPSNFTQEGENPATNWNRNNDMTFSGDYDEDDDEDDDEEEEEDDRSLDLLIRFVENVFKKISKRAHKSVRRRGRRWWSAKRVESGEATGRRWWSEEEGRRGLKTLVQVCEDKRFRRRFLMKRLRENKQSSSVRGLRAADKRGSEALLSKNKQHLSLRRSLLR